MTEVDSIKAELDLIKLIMSATFGFSFLIAFWVIQSPLGENTVVGMFGSIVIAIFLTSLIKNYVKLMKQLKDMP